MKNARHHCVGKMTRIGLVTAVNVAMMGAGGSATLALSGATPSFSADPRMTSALIGASRPEQIDDCVKALANVLFDESELAEIDQHAKDLNINLWSQSSMS